ncbi:MAG TPA: hypothetical protein VGQ94_07915 [Terriglobales bacterium]|nr:hypothetical protein [Terriglobales bacterium]
MAGKPVSKVRKVIGVLLLLPLLGLLALILLVPLFANLFAGIGIDLSLPARGLVWAAIHHPTLTVTVIILLAVFGLVVRRRTRQAEPPGGAPAE